MKGMSFMFNCEDPSKYDLVKINSNNLNVNEKYWGAWGIIQNTKEPYTLKFIGKYEHLNLDNQNNWLAKELKVY